MYNFPRKTEENDIKTLRLTFEIIILLIPELSNMSRTKRKYQTRYDDTFFKKQYKPRQRSSATARSQNDVKVEININNILPSFNQIHTPALEISSPILDAIFDAVKGD